jgi:hypothetical protein
MPTYRIHTAPAGATWSLVVDLWNGSTALRQLGSTGIEADEAAAVRTHLLVTGIPVELIVIPGTDAVAAAAWATANSATYATTGPAHDRAAAYLADPHAPASVPE